jgi:hypothetical protein
MFGFQSGFGIKLEVAIAVSSTQTKKPDKYTKMSWRRGTIPVKCGLWRSERKIKIELRQRL